MTITRDKAGNLLPRAFAFSASSQPVRTVMIDGVPYFVAKDVCACLGLTNPSVTVQSLDEDERAKYCLGRQGGAWVVNESGLYNLIFQSRKAEAKAFRRWVTGEVLPALRKTGGYGVAPKPINGVEPLIFDGQVYYNYGDVLSSFGVKRRSSASRRKSRMPDCFRLLYGRNFITARYFRTLQGYYAYKQLRFDFAASGSMLPGKEASHGTL